LIGLEVTDYLGNIHRKNDVDVHIAGASAETGYLI